jgi:disulfide bond formation protein DsbB
VSYPTTHQKTVEMVTEASKAVPPITISGMAIAGVSMQDWVLLATLLYTVLQIAMLIRKFIKEQSK